MTPLPVLLLLVAACGPASAVPQAQLPGEVVTSESSRDVTRTQSSTSQSSETKRITSGGFQNTTNTSTSTAIESTGEVRERSGARPEGSFAIQNLKDERYKDDNKTGPDGTQRTQSVETTEVNNQGVADTDGRNPLQVGEVQKTLVENVTRTGASAGPSIENTERSTSIGTVGTASGQLTQTQDNVRRSVNGGAPQVGSASTAEVEDSLGTRIARVSPDTAKRIRGAALSEVQERIKAQTEGSRTSLDSDVAQVKDIGRSKDTETKLDMSTAKERDLVGSITAYPVPADQVLKSPAENVSRIVSPLEKGNIGEMLDTKDVTRAQEDKRRDLDVEDLQTNSSNAMKAEEQLKSRGSPIVGSESHPDSVPKPGRDVEVPSGPVITPPPPATTAAPLPDGETDLSELLPQLDFTTIAPTTTSAPGLVPVTTPVPAPDPKTTPIPYPATEPTKPTQPPHSPGFGSSSGHDDYPWTFVPPSADTTTPKPSTTPAPDVTSGCPTCKVPCEGSEQQKCCWMSSSYCLGNGYSDARFQVCERCWGDEKANTERWNHI